MKKSILSIVAIAFAAVSVLSSCDKNDDGYGQSAKPQAQVSTPSAATTPSVSPTMASTAKLSLNAFAISEDLAKYGTWTVTLTDGGKTAEYDIAQQGKLGTYKTLKNTTCKGYVLAIAQPFSESIKVSVKFTPNDAAKALTEKDIIDATFGVCHTIVTDPNEEVPFNSVGMKTYAGNHVITAGEAIANLMGL